jgi:hypothetical protein
MFYALSITPNMSVTCFCKIPPRRLPDRTPTPLYRLHLRLPILLCSVALARTAHVLVRAAQLLCATSRSTTTQFPRSLLSVHSPTPPSTLKCKFFLPRFEQVGVLLQLAAAD